MNNLPKVSIITICFNSAATIADTLDSVRNQSYQSIEHIIVDGCSTDATLDIIQSKWHNGMVLKSEKDHGLYDALNKGLKMCSGDIIGILHSDDHLANPQVIETIVGFFEQDKTIEAVSSSIEIFKPGKLSKPYRVYKATNFKVWQFRIGIQPPHPGFFFHKNAITKVGYFNSSYKISGDFDWLLRAILKEKINVKYSNYVSVNMLDGGVSSSGLNSKKLMNKENQRILKAHGIYSNSFLMYLKYLFKIFQLRY
ncbi:MAG: glycosyltransferase [Bacteroidia bacterium]|nr:glycosyltransferase [Bacteroidia bacterium]